MLIHELSTQDPTNGMLTLQTLRSHDKYNTSIYGMGDRYRGIYNERKVVFVNHNDMNRLDLSQGDIVTIETVSKDNIKRRVTDFKIVQYDIPAGCLAAYYPETNPLVPLGSMPRTPEPPPINQLQ